jgi:alpha-D-xyloside xylohydrolase
MFDDDESDPESAVEVARMFSRLKLELMPYLYAAGREAHESGTPLMRPMLLGFAGDPAVAYLDRQYLLGPDLLVAPVFSATGDVDFYLPAGGWTDFWTGERTTGGGWRRERHGFRSLPLYVRDGAVLPRGARRDRPDYDYADGLVLELYPGSSSGDREIALTRPDGSQVVFQATWGDGRAVATGDVLAGWSLRIAGSDRTTEAVAGKAEISW